MKVEQYQVKNNMSMDPMHDSYADEIRIENNYLIIVYDKLDEGVLGPDGLPEYKNKKNVALCVVFSTYIYCLYDYYHPSCTVDSVLFLYRFRWIIRL